MLDNCLYDKIKLLHQLSSAAWFIQKHALENAKKRGDAASIAELETLHSSLEAHIQKLHELLKAC